MLLKLVALFVHAQLGDLKLELGLERPNPRRATLGALLPLYHFIAWSRDNDYVSIRDVLQKEKQAKRQRGLARNDEVRVVRGMLAGKIGVIQEIDARGGLRVLVGKMALKLDAQDVIKS